MNKTPEELQEIGKNVVLFQEEKKKYAKKHYIEWFKDGQRFRLARKILRVSLSLIAKRVGCSLGPIQRFERGLSIKRRNVVRAAYYQALRVIYLEQLIALSNANQKPPQDIILHTDIHGFNKVQKGI